MKVISTCGETHLYLKNEKYHGRTLGLVPTMGALHEGHCSLIRAAVRETEIPIVSIFVNPTQFGPDEDLDRYPRQEQGDLELCATEGVKVVFLPPADEIYPPGYRSFVEVESLGNKLCGKTRPTHFRGVTTIVNRLFHIVQPNKAYFGLKDRQQFVILRRMVKDLGWNIEMIGLPTVRESDGLALSSRNAYLTPEERKAAPLLFQALCEAKEAFECGETAPEQLRRNVISSIESDPLIKIDYVEVVEPVGLETPETVAQGDFIALAAFLGKTRLIDNLEMA